MSAATSSSNSSSAAPTCACSVRDPSKANFPAGVEVAQGELLDIDALRSAFTGVSTLFLLNAVAGDEFTQAHHRPERRSGVRRRAGRLSVGDPRRWRFVNVPHFAVKSGAERMIEQMGFSATILRPAYFIDNEVMIKDVIFNHGVYPMPIGGKGVAMVDARDIAEVAAIELIRREQAPGKLPIETINLVGPDTLTGSDVAAIWSRCPGPPGRLWRRRSQRVRAEPGATSCRSGWPMRCA